MNNLYGQTQILGKATMTSNPIDNGDFNYVLPYNKSDFFSYSDEITFSDKTNCQYFNLNDANLDNLCKKNPNYTMEIKDNSGNTVKLKDKYCYSRELCKNKKIADDITNRDEIHASNNVKYLDTVTDTNLQTINITNLTMGIIIMLVLTFTYSK